MSVRRLRTFFLVMTAAFCPVTGLHAQPATILSPVDGESVEQGSVYTIRWSQDDPQTQMIVKFSPDSGLNINPLSSKSDLGATTYEWDVRADLFPVSTQCYVYVAIYYAQHLYGQSGMFSIVPRGSSRVRRTEPLTVMSPAGAPARHFTVNGRSIAPESVEILRSSTAIVGRILRVGRTDAAIVSALEVNQRR